MTSSKKLIEAAARTAVSKLIESHKTLFFIDFLGEAKISSSIWANPMKSCSTSSTATSIMSSTVILPKR